MDGIWNVKRFQLIGGLGSNFRRLQEIGMIGVWMRAPRLADEPLAGEDRRSRVPGLIAAWVGDSALVAVR
jgi:hypothetical protein